MKRILFVVLTSLVFGQATRAGNVPVEPTMYQAPTELAQPGDLVKALELVREVKADIEVLRVVGGLRAQITGGHSAALSWILSVDDTTTNCTTTANCLQNVYRASGSCSTTSNFSLLTTTALSATATAYTDSTLTPGVWCYGTTFEINGLESAKDTATVTLQPAPQTGLTAITK